MSGMERRLLPGFHCDIEAQIILLHEILKRNEVVYQVISCAEKLELGPYYIGAGCICQTVWNVQNHLDPMHGISDIDLVYFDSKDLSYEAEDAVIKKVQHAFSGIPVPIDVKNQARVHLWYADFFGYDIAPISCLEEAINTWPTTATSIGVRMTNGRLVVCAPFGLNDMFGQIVRANKTQITKETYEKKCNKWASKWDTLTIIEW